MVVFMLFLGHPNSVPHRESVGGPLGWYTLRSCLTFQGALGTRGYIPNKKYPRDIIYGVYPIGSMGPGIFTNIWLIFCGKCRQIYVDHRRSYGYGVDSEGAPIPRGPIAFSP